MLRHEFYIEFEGEKVPAKVYEEPRKNVRFGFGKTGVHLRLPLGMPPKDKKRFVEDFKVWVCNKLSERADLRRTFERKTYHDGQELQVGPKTYRLHLRRSQNRTHKGRFSPGGDIYLWLSEVDSEAERQKALRHLLSRLIARDQLPRIERRVQELNERHFRQPIRGVKLKYLKSRWGSCSGKGNINLSTRLLFAPAEVLDYVIIHELAHLIEMNHSPRFWKLVEQAMPDYREKERWLKENAADCDW